MNLIKEAGHVLASVAPTLATALGGPFAGGAVTALEAAFGIGKDAAPADKQKAIEQALLGGDPAVLLAAKQADQAFQVQLETLGIQKDKLVFDDLAGARGMQVATRDPIVARLAWTIIGGFIGISAGQLLAMVVWPEALAKIPAQGWLLVGNISGYLANEAKQAAAFYFGSTAGSQAKDATISEIARGP